MDRFLVLTYPRCGSHFLQYCLKMSCSVQVLKTHTIYRMLDKTVSQYGPDLFDEFENKIVTIIRDPFDSIASLMSVRKVVKPEASDDYQEAIEYYKESLKTLNSMNIVFIKYEDLEQINLVTKAVSKIFGLSWNSIENPEYDYNEYGKENIESFKFYSSKTRDTYSEIVKRLNKENLSECYDLYKIALSKCISIAD